MKKKVFLVYPHEKTHFVRLSLSLLSIASSLEPAGYDVKIIDMRFQDPKKYDFKDALFVGLTSFTGSNLKSAIEFSKYIKKRYPNVPVVWGGVHASILPIQTISNDYVDIIVRGEGDLTAVELAKALEKKKPLKNVQGLTFKENGKIINTPERPFLNMNDLPPQAYHLVNLTKAETTLGHFPYNGSRGCPHRCKFCFNVNFHKSKWRSVTAQRTVEDIKKIIEVSNTKGIEFTEDNFFTSKERIREIAEGIIKNNIKITWGAACRMDYFARYEIEFLKLLKKSGLDLMSGGAESGSQRILDLVNKDIKVEDTIKAVAKAKEAGIVPCLSFICGVPTETKKDVFMTLDLIDKLRKINPDTQVNGFFAFTIYPGDPLVEDCKKLGYKEPKTLEGWANHNLSDFNTQVWLSKKEIEWLETISDIIRFDYFNQTGRVYENLNVKWHYIPYLMMRAVYTVSARVRWRLRFFSYAYEWRLWSWVKEKYLGHF